MSTIKSIIIFGSKYSNAYKKLAISQKDKFNFIELDSKESRRIIQGKLNELPSCLVISEDNSFTIYHGFEKTQEIITKSEQYFSAQELQTTQNEQNEQNIQEIRNNAKNDPYYIPEKHIKEGEGLENCQQTSLSNTVIQTEQKNVKREKVNIHEVMSKENADREQKDFSKDVRLIP